MHHRHIGPLSRELKREREKRSIELDGVLEFIERNPQEAKQYIFLTWAKEMGIQVWFSKKSNTWMKEDGEIITNVNCNDCGSNEEEDEDEDEDTIHGYSPKKSYSAFHLILTVDPGMGFQLMDGNNVLVHYSKREDASLADWPIAFCKRRRTDIRPIMLSIPPLLHSQHGNNGTCAKDVITIIAKYVSLLDVFNLMMVCKSWNRSLKGNVDVWNSKLRLLSRATTSTCIAGEPRSLVSCIVKDPLHACRRLALWNRLDFDAFTRHIGRTASLFVKIMTAHVHGIPLQSRSIRQHSRDSESPETYGWTMAFGLLVGGYSVVINVEKKTLTFSLMYGLGKPITRTIQECLEIYHAFINKCTKLP